VTTLLLLAILAPPADTLVFRGQDGQLQVTPPRIETPDITVDGRLDEPVWEEAASLQGFTQYEPVEGIPSTEETEVRVL
jgi:hypothetical protein